MKLTITTQASVDGVMQGPDTGPDLALDLGKSRRHGAKEAEAGICLFAGNAELPSADLDRHFPAESTT
jgi:hypothetical protein